MPPVHASRSPRGRPVLLLLAGLACACGGDDLPPKRDLGSSSCAPAFAGCLSFAEATGPIQFGGAAGMDYSPRCLRVALSEVVRFEGDFGFHPLEQACGPDAIPATTSGSALSATLPSPGLYGYYCTSHGNRTGQGMAGAILVSP